MRVLKSLKVKNVKNQKFLLKYFSMDKKAAYKISGQYIHKQRRYRRL